MEDRYVYIALFSRGEDWTDWDYISEDVYNRFVELLSLKSNYPATVTINIKPTQTEFGILQEINLKGIKDIKDCFSVIRVLKDDYIFPKTPIRSPWNFNIIKFFSNFLISKKGSEFIENAKKYKKEEAIDRLYEKMTNRLLMVDGINEKYNDVDVSEIMNIFQEFKEKLIDIEKEYKKF